MSNKPIIIFVQPIDKYFVWQIHLYVESCIQQGGFEEENIHVLLYKPVNREYNKAEWDKLKQCYPKLNIFVYEDKGVGQYMGIYIPILRPHTLWQHFLALPSLENETIIYTDCDILWTGVPDIEKFYDDDVCYISDAKSYLNSDYFDSKIKDVIPEKLEEYKKRDILEEICTIVGIPKAKAVENNNNSGGVQYILKHINADFWKKVQDDVLSMKVHLGGVNKEFFASENKGIQSWCSDLWAIQFNLWYRNLEVKVVPELNFAWATDSIDKLKTTTIFHNAGVTNVMHGDVPMFYKGKYHTGADPTKDEHLKTVLNDERSKKLCTWYYANKLRQLSDKYMIDY